MRTLRRDGITRVEAIVVIGIAGLFFALCAPLIFSSRESARLSACQDNLRQLSVALHAYHDMHHTLPPAAVWNSGPFASLSLHQTKRIDLVTHENWVMFLLPYLGREDLAQQFESGQPVGADANEPVRMTTLAEMTCPSDEYNRPDNPHIFHSTPDREVRFSRGNYAINGGTHGHKTGPGDTASRNGDYAQLKIDTEKREFRLWGNGIGGFNVSFSLKDFSNGTSTLVALEEIRAGIHSLDPRGCWALGQVGGSVTWGHGVNCDAYGPNNPWSQSDDLLGCGELHETVGADFLERERMPCVPYVDANQNATARSRHDEGVNVLFLDGATRFISNNIDPGLWHVIHSRETPSKVLADDFEKRLATTNITREADYLNETVQIPDAEPFSGITNSQGMEFVMLPAGEFTMGLPDKNNGNAPPNVPAHQVGISRPFYMGKFEVTRKQYESLMKMDFGDDQTTNLPVENVTWHEAEEFCRRLSELPAERNAGRRYRLPTEAEWEYACRAGSNEPYDWTPTRPPGDDSGEAAGIRPALPLTPVGSYPANPFGLHDMRGNVWEWTADWFDRDYYVRSSSTDPQGPAEGYIKVVRGGDWRFIGEKCHIDYPMLPPWMESPFVGFRLVCELQTKSPGSVASADNFEN